MQRKKPGGMDAPKAISRRARTKGKRISGPEPPIIVLTIGHSTRAIEEFICLLHAHGVSGVTDVRTVPRSRHNPQFNADSLPGSLKKAGLGYVHLAAHSRRPDDVIDGRFHWAHVFRHHRCFDFPVSVMVGTNA
jgi:uncharacterized protein DUF488